MRENRGDVREYRVRVQEYKGDMGSKKDGIEMHPINRHFKSTETLKVDTRTLRNHMEGRQDAAITGSGIGNHVLNRHKVFSGDDWFMMMIGHPVLVSVARVLLGLMVKVIGRPGFPGQDISAMPFIG